MVAKVTITLKNEEKTQKKDFLVYEKFTASQDDPTIQEFLRESSKEFNAEIEKVRIKVDILTDPLPEPNA